MLRLADSIRVVSKIGPKYQKLLEKLEIKTVGDLIYHFPFRYDDFSVIKKISEIKETETVTVTAVLQKIDNIFTRYGKRITTAKVSDETGNLNLIWFNQHYIKQSFTVGESYNFSGTIKKFSGKLTLVSPEFEVPKTKNINTGTLVPIYTETSGISSKWLRSRINDVIDGLGELKEFLPEDVLNKYKFDEINSALKSFHFPNSLQEANFAKTRFVFEELFLELLKIENLKLKWETKFFGYQFKIAEHQDQINKLTKSLPFTLTDSQVRSLKEIFDSLSQKHPMNKLLEGDVGTGKTVVAVIASCLAVLNGFRVVYMAPTEILANQHFETFKKFLSPFNVKVVLKTSGNKIRLDKKEFDIAIGTHALLYAPNTSDSEDQKDKNGLKLGLVIIDEQHRFGVEQRARLAEMYTVKNNIIPHLLTMTATPIPRTLALTLYGDLSISKLDAPPNSGKKITTRVVSESKREKTYEWIKSKNESAFIVCPLINESETEALENVKAAQDEFKKLKEVIFKDLEVGLLHGRMKSKEKQEVIEKFKTGKIKVLVSTPVIEVGVDIPEATIMVIESAERYGLASLHQLRGRVGRGNKEGFCLLFMSNNFRGAYRRLKYLEQISSGLELAEIDMKIRGHGDIYGTMQHGYKRFKVASLNDLETLENAKLEVQTIFPKINEYPGLKEKLAEIEATPVRDN